MVVVGKVGEWWWWMDVVGCGDGWWWWWWGVVLGGSGGDPHLHYESEEGPYLVNRVVPHLRGDRG